MSKSKKQQTEYPHRGRTATCRGVMSQTHGPFGPWAHWSPPLGQWLPFPTCPACFQIKGDFTGRAVAGNSYSRYSSQYICSDCGRNEAFSGFFWRFHCDPSLIKEHHRYDDEVAALKAKRR